MAPALIIQHHVLFPICCFVTQIAPCIVLNFIEKPRGQKGKRKKKAKLFYLPAFGSFR